MNSDLKLIAKNSFWLIVSRILNAAIQFFTVPLIISFYGKEQYGLIVLALSLNAYLNISNLGLPAGLVRFIAGYLNTKDYKRISNVARSSFLFHLFVGLINAAIFSIIAYFGSSIFEISYENNELFKNIFLIAGGGVLISWPFSVVDQYLTAAEEITWLSKINIIQYVLQFFAILVAKFFDLEITVFFILSILFRHILIPAKVWKWSKYVSFKNSFKFGWFWEDFKGVLKFSIGMFVIGLSIISATHLRPVLFASKVKDSFTYLAEYQVMFTIVNFLIMLNGVFLNVLLPASSKAVALNDDKLLNSIIYKATKYSWTFTSLLIFLVILNSKNLLLIYVGEDFLYLSGYLCIWTFSLVAIYQGAISSVIISKGEINFLSKFHLFGTLISLLFVFIYADELKLESIIWSIVIYYLLQFVFYHVYLIPKVLKIDVLSFLGKYFLPPLAAGVILYVSGFLTLQYINVSSPFWNIVIVSSVGVACFLFFTIKFIIPVSEIKSLVNSLLKK